MIIAPPGLLPTRLSPCWSEPQSRCSFSRDWGIMIPRCTKKACTDSHPKGGNGYVKRKRKDMRHHRCRDDSRPVGRCAGDVRQVRGKGPRSGKCLRSGSLSGCRRIRRLRWCERIKEVEMARASGPFPCPEDGGRPVPYSVAGKRRRRAATTNASATSRLIMAATPGQPRRTQKSPPTVPEMLEPR